MSSILSELKITAQSALNNAHNDVVNYVRELEASVKSARTVAIVCGICGTILGYALHALVK